MPRKRSPMVGMTERGLRAPLRAVIDGNPGLRQALGRSRPSTAVQHALDELREDFHRIVYAVSGDAGRAAVTAFERKWGKRCPGVVRSLQEGGAELLTFLTSPKAQWKTLRTTNVIAEDRHRAQSARVGGGMMILRTALVALFTLGILAAPLAVEAQPTGKVWRIGFLRGSAPPQSEIEAFRQGLRELGYVEGKNLVIEYRWAEGKEERLPSLAAELMLLNVDLILSSAPAATRAAKEATTTIPIVMVTVADPVAFGFVRSLARPGGNVTGFAFQHPELSGKRLALLKEAIPKLSRLAVLWNGANPYKAVDMKEVQAAADTSGVTLQSLPVDGPQDLERAFGAAKQGRADALITLEDPFTIAHRVRIVDLTRTHQLPALYGRRVYVDAGGLMSYGPDPIEQYRRAANYVDRIFKGTKPADLPVEQPTRFELVINVRTAKALGLTLPPSLVLQADQTIE